jgi:hypothetical protein
MNKFTPGPWILSETEVVRHGDTAPTKICEIFCSNNNKLICEIPDYRYHQEYDASDAADARLIAAAPCLLEALEDAVTSMLDSGYNASEAVVIRKARAAIASAKGESN